MTEDKLELLIAAWLDGRITEKESARLQKQLLESQAARQLFARYAKLDAGLRQVADDELHQIALTESSRNLIAMNLSDQNLGDHGLGELDVETDSKYRADASSSRGLGSHELGSHDRGSRKLALGWMTLAVAASALFLLTSLGWLPSNSKQDKDLQSPTQFANASAEPMIASVKGLSGPIRWTGNGGRVQHELAIGERLPGGTIDGLAPESWFALEFNDGSVVTLSGSSMLTFSDDGQKVLHLKSGQLAADIAKQPSGMPMILHTRSAQLTVLGTRFEVDAGLPETSVMVTEGSVRVARKSDGKSIEVGAQRRLTASADSELVTEMVPETATNWSSGIGRGPMEAFGEWTAAGEGRPAMVKSVAHVPEVAPSVVIYLVGMGVGRKTQAPVQVLEHSRFEVRGVTKVDTPLFFGCQVNTPNGQFAGKFMTQAKVRRDDSGEFVAEFQVQDLSLDPTLEDSREVLAESPAGLILQSVWCFTHSDEPSGLAVSDISLQASY